MPWQSSVKLKFNYIFWLPDTDLFLLLTPHVLNSFQVRISERPFQNLIFWLMVVGFPEEFGDNPPSWLFYVLSLEQQIHWQQNSPHSTVLGVGCLTFSPTNILLLIVLNSPVFISSDQRVFLQKVFSLSIWSAANFSWALRCLVLARVSFLHSSLSAHELKHPWLWAMTPVFQQLLIYCRLIITHF